MKIYRIIVISIIVLVAFAFKIVETHSVNNKELVKEFNMVPHLTRDSQVEGSCTTIQDRGFLRVDDNGRYFVFDDGTPYIPIGLNKFPLYLLEDSAIDSLLSKWSEHDINYLRIWVGIGADPEIEVGKYDEERMRKLDFIIRSCEKYGIYLVICFWNDNCIREQDGEWGWNGSQQIYNKDNHPQGTTTDANDLKDVAHKPSWDAMQNRFRHFVERWKDEPIIIIWDLVNDSKKTEAWKTQMYEFVKEIDETGRIITFQYNTGKDPKGEMDCGSVRVYNYNPEGNDPEEMMISLAERIRQGISHGDPVYCGEGRMDYENGSSYELERGYLHFLWGPMAVGAAGNLHSWTSILYSKDRWPNPSEQELNWTKHYAEFCKKINWAQFNSRNVNEEIEPVQSNIKAFACRSNSEMLLYLMNDDPAHEFKTTHTQLKITSDFDEGLYVLNWIDIRTGKSIHSSEISTFPGIVETPDFKDGLFCHIQKKE